MATLTPNSVTIQDTLKTYVITEVNKKLGGTEKQERNVGQEIYYTSKTRASCVLLGPAAHRK